MKYLLDILELLSAKGHRVTYVSIDKYKKFGDNYSVTHHSLGNIPIEVDDLVVDIDPFTSDVRMMDFLKLSGQVFASLYAKTFPEYEKFYAEDRPDLMICDYVAAGCIDSAVKHTLPLVIGYQTFTYHLPPPYLNLLPGLSSTTIEGKSFLQRFKSMVIDRFFIIRDYFAGITAFDEVRKLHGVQKRLSFPAFDYMGLGLVNNFIGLENPRQLPTHLNMIGPIMSESYPPLTTDLQEFLDNNAKVLYIAFGSKGQARPKLAEFLLAQFQRAINEGVADAIVWGGLSKFTLERFPKSYTLNGKEYSTDSMLDGSNSKIKLMGWAPQQSILDHPNTKLFLSHGGLDSVYESVTSGTPMLFLPFLGDQPGNSMLLTERGVGDYIDYPKMSSDQVYEKLKRLMDPDNLEVLAKVKQLQLIIKFSSSRTQLAADLVETYAKSAQACRAYEKPQPFEIPCEMRPYLPLDNRINWFIANGFDVYLTALGLGLGAIAFGMYLLTYLVFIMVKNEEAKEKKKVE
jgi:UDP:flavonoid glycosyltransferase YjiC (YdhE family)